MPPSGQGPRGRGKAALRTPVPIAGAQTPAGLAPGRPHGLTHGSRGAGVCAWLRCVLGSGSQPPDCKEAGFQGPRTDGGTREA